jgi:hypothetical protein
VNRRQLADIIILGAEPSLEAAAVSAAATLAELTGCALVAVEVPGSGVLLATRPSQRVLAPPGDVMRTAVAAYESLLREGGVLLSRSVSSAALGSPLAE